MWGIIPAAGTGSRIQPLAFSKELLPVGSYSDGGIERPCAVGEYLIERMLFAGASKLCFVISPGKADILNYFGGEFCSASLFYAVQQQPAGLCDAVFRAAPLIGPEEDVCIGLPDTIWFPADALCRVKSDCLSLLLFPVEHPERFDAVLTHEDGRVREVQVKHQHAATHWVWGAMRMPGSIFHQLHSLWLPRQDEYLGTLFNAYLARGGDIFASKLGESYVDVGTLHGYREALGVLHRSSVGTAASG